MTADRERQAMRSHMPRERDWIVSILTIGVVALAACAEGGPGASASASESVVKGGDDRTGEYDAVADWWGPAPDHIGPWTWGQVSGVAVDSPDRIIVAIWGDRDGEIIENWSQWDSLFNKPHQV